METRPPLTARLTGTELRRWYWLHSELIDFARTLGVATAGGKVALTERVAFALDGQPPPPGSGGRRSVGGAQLVGPLTEDTVIPTGQRCSQRLRAYFVAHLGAGFHFDAPMREFISTGGRTLGEALEYWRTTRPAHPRPSAATEISAQFELNRFTRAWHQTHPGRPRAELLAAWAHYRSLPVEARSRASVP